MTAHLPTRLTTTSAIQLKNGMRTRHPVCYTVGMRLGWSFVLLLALGCTSPTLPLPPPEAPTESAGADPQTVILVGAHATPGGLMIVVNENTNYATPAAAAIVKSDGTWTATVNAVKNDVLQIYEQVGNEDTQTLDYTVLIN